MKLFAFGLPSLMRFFGRVETAKVKFLPVVGGLRPPLVLTPRLPAHSFRKPARGSIPVSVSRIVPNVLGMRTGSEVLDSVIQGISVNVIHYMTLRNLNSMESQDNSVNHHLVVNSTEISVDAHVGHSLSGSLVNNAPGFLPSPSGIGTLPQIVRDKMMSRPLFPEQFPGLRVVSKRLLKKFNGGQLFSRMHNQVFGYVSRRIRELRTLGAPSLYTLTAVSQ